jgi:hypothetical protein
MYLLYDFVVSSCLDIVEGGVGAKEVRWIHMLVSCSGQVFSLIAHALFVSQSA